MKHVECDRCHEDFGAMSAQPIDTTWVEVDGLAVMVMLSIYEDKSGAHYPDLCKKCQGDVFAAARVRDEVTA